MKVLSSSLAVFSLLYITTSFAHMAEKNTGTVLNVSLYFNTGASPKLFAEGTQGGQEVFHSSAPPKSTDNDGTFTYTITIDEADSINLQVGRSQAPCVNGTSPNIPYRKGGQILNSVHLVANYNSNNQLVCQWKNPKY